MPLPDPAPDRVALVTGASSGIGAALARELAGRGHGVVLVARRDDLLRTLADELATTGVRAEVVTADLTDRAVRAGLPERIGSLGLTVDVLVNDAGSSTFGPVAGADPGAELAMLELDVLAVADLCTRFVPAMVSAGRGGVLNVASTGAFQPLPGQAAYGAAKAFVLSYTESLAGELRGTGVTATVVCPGPVRTGFGAAAGFSDEDAEAMLPSFLWETPADVARVAVDALAAGRTVAVPGLGNRVGTVVGRLVPHRWLVPVLARSHPALRPS